MRATDKQIRPIVSLEFLLRLCNGKLMDSRNFTKCKFPSLEMSSLFVKKLEGIYGGSSVGVFHNRKDFIVVF